MGRSRGAVAALVLATGALLAGAGGATAAVSSSGSLGFAPSSGTAATPLSVVSSGRCSDPSASNLLLTVVGNGFPADGQNVAPNSRASIFGRNSATGGYQVPLMDTLEDFAAEQTPPATLSGRYEFTLACVTGTGDEGRVAFRGSVWFSSQGQFAETAGDLAVGSTPAAAAPTATVTPRSVTPRSAAPRSAAPRTSTARTAAPRTTSGQPPSPAPVVATPLPSTVSATTAAVGPLAPSTARPSLARPVASSAAPTTMVAAATVASAPSTSSASPAVPEAAAPRSSGGHVRPAAVAIALMSLLCVAGMIARRRTRGGGAA